MDLMVENEDGNMELLPASSFSIMLGVHNRNIDNEQYRSVRTKGYCKDCGKLGLELNNLY